MSSPTLPAFFITSWQIFSTQDTECQPMVWYMTTLIFAIVPSLPCLWLSQFWVHRYIRYLIRFIALIMWFTGLDFMQYFSCTGFHSFGVKQCTNSRGSEKHHPKSRFRIILFNWTPQYHASHRSMVLFSGDRTEYICSGRRHISIHSKCFDELFFNQLSLWRLNPNKQSSNVQDQLRPHQIWLPATVGGWRYCTHQRTQRSSQVIPLPFFQRAMLITTPAILTQQMHFSLQQSTWSTKSPEIRR